MSLQEQCLDIILNNFHKYHAAYTATEEMSSKIKYEFLRRKFSFQIAEKLHENNEFNIDYMDFVLNKFLKSMNTHWVQDFPWEAVAKKFFEIGPSLETVYFSDGHDHWEEIVCHLPNLLYAFFGYCNNSYLQLISEFCPKIQSIDCNSSSFSKDGLKHLCSPKNGHYPCPDLKEVKLGDWESHSLYGDDENNLDEGIGYLIKNLPHLENLEYSNLPAVLYNNHKDDINTLDKIKPYNLTNLQLIDLLHSQTVDDILKICVSLCPNLEKFSCLVQNESHLDLCSQLSKLQEVHLSNDRESPLDLNNFLKLRGGLLTSLKIQNFSLLASNVLQKCGKLTSLSMNKITFQDDESDYKVTIPNLKELAFKNMILIETVIGKVVSSFLASFPNLDTLSFNFCEVYSSDIKTAIMKCCEQNKLKVISFEGSVIDAKFVQDVLVSCSSLDALNLEHSELSNGDDDILMRLEAIAQTLPNNPFILYDDDHNSDFSDYEHFMNDYDDYYNTDDDEEYGYDDSDYDDHDYYEQ